MEEIDLVIYRTTVDADSYSVDDVFDEAVTTVHNELSNHREAFEEQRERWETCCGDLGSIPLPDEVGDGGASFDAAYTALEEHREKIAAAERRMHEAFLGLYITGKKGELLHTVSDDEMQMLQDVAAEAAADADVLGISFWADPDTVEYQPVVEKTAEGYNVSVYPIPTGETELIVNLEEKDEVENMDAMLQEEIEEYENTIGLNALRQAADDGDVENGELIDSRSGFNPG